MSLFACYSLIYPFIDVLIYLFIYLFVYLCNYLFIHLIIHFSSPSVDDFHVTGALKLKVLIEASAVDSSPSRGLWLLPGFFFVPNLPPTSGDVITSERCEEAIRGLMPPLYGKRDTYKRAPYL